MELEELKKTWSALDEKLEENNRLNEKIISEMIEKKASKSLNKLIFWDEFTLIFSLLLIPLLVYLITTFHGKLVFWDIAMIYLLINLIVGVVWFFIKIKGLMKININENVSNNIYHLNKYNIQIRKEKFYTNYILGAPAAILFTLTYGEAKASLWMWVFLVCMLILSSVVTYFSYKRFSQKNIDSIRESLEEIKDLREE